MQVDTSCIRKKLLECTDVSELKRLSLEAQYLLESTGSFSKDLFNASTPSDMQSYAMLAVLQAEARQAGICESTMGDEMIKCCAIDISTMNQFSKDALIAGHVARVTETDISDLYDVQSSDLTPETKTEIFSRVFPVLESYAYLVALGTCTNIPGRLLLLISVSI